MLEWKSHSSYNVEAIFTVMKVYLMKKKLISYYFGFQLFLINKYFKHENKTLEEISTFYFDILLKQVPKFKTLNSNLAQNSNLSFLSVSENIVKTTLDLERLVKQCKKNTFDEKSRQLFKLKRVNTYSYFSDDEGSIVDKDLYIDRVVSAIQFLVEFFNENRKKVGTLEYANCVTIFMHLESFYTFSLELSHVLMDKKILN